MISPYIEQIATILFAFAILHTFTCSNIQRFSHRFKKDSVGEALFHLLGEVEIVFGLWAAILIGMFALIQGAADSVRYAESLDFTEALFVFVIMTIAATRPVIQLARNLILGSARLLPLAPDLADLLACLIIGPLLGSIITEPAAMTVTALILKDRFFDRCLGARFMYPVLAVLFVNVSIGGVLTPFAAPPVLMVANKWDWDILFMLRTFGWKAVLAVILNAIVVVWFVRRHMVFPHSDRSHRPASSAPAWLKAVHLLFLLLVIIGAHHPVIFIGAFLFFLGLTTVTRPYQSELKIRQSLQVAFFLGGLTVLGGLQRWWLEPLIRGMHALPLFLGTTVLTAFTDNAALTFLGSQIDGVTDSFKYRLVSAAVAGGGLTVIANAPNPAGYSILQPCFGSQGILPWRLARAALVPTLIAMVGFWFL